MTARSKGPTASIDRFEGEWAVLEMNGRTEKRRRDTLAADAKEGDVIDLATGQVDREATAALRAEVRAARERALGAKKPPSGNFDL